MIEFMQQQERRVVITGLGAVTPLGNDLSSFWDGLIHGRSGVALITDFDCSAIATRIASQVKGFDIESFIDRKEAKRMDRFVHLALAASIMAARDADLSVTDANRERVGVFVGSGIGGIQTLEEQHKKMLEGGLGRVSPFFIPMMIANMATGHIAKYLGAQGPSETAVTACATSSNSIGDAFWIVRQGKADVALAGGTESAVTPLAMAGFSNMRAMSRRNDDPERASRPFDRGRDGFILGEGAGIVVLEELSIAQARGARIYAEVLGCGLSNDAYDMVHPAPEGAGAARAIKAALLDASVDAASIGYVNAHGTSTPAGDVLEIMAVKKVFGAHASELAVSSTKSMTGHLLGAAGAVEAIATAKALETGILPPTINLDDPDPECDLDLVPNKARERQVEYAISNSFGFGGHNATLVLRRWTGS
jgi:3-oxoacyl-[acyl-carrier-protein] synthase II